MLSMRQDAQRAGRWLVKAMIINGFGGADRLEMAEVPTPTAQADEVLIRVAYAGCQSRRLENPRGHARRAFPASLSVGPRLGRSRHRGRSRNGSDRLSGRRQGLRILPQADRAVGNLCRVYGHGVLSGGADTGQPNLRSGCRHSVDGTHVLAGVVRRRTAESRAVGLDPCGCRRYRWHGNSVRKACRRDGVHDGKRRQP